MAPRTVEDLLVGRPLVAVTGNSTVAAACCRMREHRVGALAVLAEERLAGILSERDIAVSVIAGHRDPMLTLVREVMTLKPRTVPASTDVATAFHAMSEGGFRHLPVTRGGAVIGMLSMRDIPILSHRLNLAGKEAPVLALG
jgi:CBS domain-containing protein